MNPIVQTQREIWMHNAFWKCIHDDTLSFTHEIPLQILITRRRRNSQKGTEKIVFNKWAFIMTFDANRLKFFTLFLCKIFTTQKVRTGKIIITFLNGISRYAFFGWTLEGNECWCGVTRWRFLETQLEVIFGNTF